MAHDEWVLIGPNIDFISFQAHKGKGTWWSLFWPNLVPKTKCQLRHNSEATQGTVLLQLFLEWSNFTFSGNGMRAVCPVGLNTLASSPSLNAFSYHLSLDWNRNSSLTRLYLHCFRTTSPSHRPLQKHLHTNEACLNRKKGMSCLATWITSRFPQVCRSAKLTPWYPRDPDNIPKVSQ